MQDLIVVGGGEHSRVVIEAARCATREWNVLGFVDHVSCDETSARLNFPRLGDDDSLAKYPHASLLLGVGSVGVDRRRQELVGRLGVPDERWAVVIHKAAWVSPTAAIEAGSAVLAGATINSGARVGQHCIINNNTVLDHDVVLGAYVHASHGSVVAGGSVIGDGSYIGMGALVRDHLTLGRSCLIGMGAVVTKSFEADAVLIGVPAKNVERRG